MKVYIISEMLMGEDSYIHQVYLNEMEAYIECNKLNKETTGDKIKYCVEEYDASGTIPNYNDGKSVLEKIYNLSSFAWEQKVEAGEILKKIYELSKTFKK